MSKKIVATAATSITCLASSAINLQSSSAINLKAPLELNPFTLTDEVISNHIIGIHDSHATKHDVDSLYKVVSNIVKSSTHIGQSLDLKRPKAVELIEDKVPKSNFMPSFSTMKEIAYQMTCKPFSTSTAHQTIVGILEKLRIYTWDAKAVIALSAFALDYGETWHLSLMETTKENALELHIFRLGEEGKPSQDNEDLISTLVDRTLQLIEGILKLEKMIANKTYSPRDLPTLYAAPRDIYTYWAILALLTGANRMTEPDWNIKSEVVGRLKLVLTRLNNDLAQITREIALIEDLTWRLVTFHSPSGILQLWKALISLKEIVQHEIFDNTTKEGVSAQNIELEGKPIVVVTDPQGEAIHKNALHMIFVWKTQAFPFTPEREVELSLHWNWFWNEATKVHPEIKTWLRENKYIFIYGGTNNALTQNFGRQLDVIKSDDPDIKRAAAKLEHFNLGEVDSTMISDFLKNITYLFLSKVQKDNYEQDSLLKDILTSLSNKNEKEWALLSKGENVLVIGNYSLMTRVLNVFKDWRLNGLEQQDFIDHYNTRKPPIPHCLHLQLGNIRSGIPPISIFCPEPFCQLKMEIETVSYKCCHGIHYHDASENGENDPSPEDEMDS